MITDIYHSYSYQNPERAITIDKFIQCKSDNYICQHMLSFRDKVDGIEYSTYDVVSEYLDDIRNMCPLVHLGTKDAMKYYMRPKQLCHDLYGNGELAYILLLINDMSNIKQFTKNEILIPTPGTMNTICTRIYNATISNIKKYNSIHS